MARNTKHIDRILEVAGDPGAAARSRLAASWRRSLTHHGIDPAQGGAVRRVDGTLLTERLERSESILRVASPRLDSLFQLVGSSGCGVLLTDDMGVVLDVRVGDGDQKVFESWGLALGSDWSEASEGTNGVGTCIAEARRVTIHRDEHFRVQNIDMSCMDAPIFGADGSLIGALDVSSARADQTEAFNRLIAAQVAQTARQIEVDHFRASFPTARIIVADTDGSEAAMLLAVDRDDLVIGATRGARKVFGLNPTGALAALPASDLFGREDESDDFEQAERAAVIRALVRTQGNVSEAARTLGIGRATLYRRMKRLGIGDGSFELSQN